jgi:putative SOS response-associated peptidase YedK
MRRFRTPRSSPFLQCCIARMPLVLELDEVGAWLGATPDEAAALMRPTKNVRQERPLGKAINNVKNNYPELLAAG